MTLKAYVKAVPLRNPFPPARDWSVPMQNGALQRTHFLGRSQNLTQGTLNVSHNGRQKTKLFKKLKDKSENMALLSVCSLQVVQGNTSPNGSLINHTYSKQSLLSSYISRFSEQL